MTYSLEFDRRALKEWNKLGDTLRQQFKKKLAEVLENPRIEANRLRQLPDCYKLKLRSAGYRLIYQVLDQEVVVLMVAIGKRERRLCFRRPASTVGCRRVKPACPASNRLSASWPVMTPSWRTNRNNRTTKDRGLQLRKNAAVALFHPHG
jgi:mRNA interferase RelE/StbE